MRACNALLKLFLLWIVGQTITGCNGPDQVAGVEGSGAPVAFTGGVVGNGQITALGSIYVGGVEYSLDHANIQIDGQPGSASQLIVGQIVTVNGKFGDGPATAQASTVIYEPDLIGPISAIDTAHRQITVLGQQVSIDDDKAPTIIDMSINPASFEGLTTGLQVEISGFTNAQGVLSARRITVQAAGSAYAVDGVVEKIDQSAKTFSVRALGIDFNGADLRAIAGGALKNGDTVRVEGRKFDAAGTLSASKISLYSIALPGAVGDTAIVEGWITRYVSNADFDVNGHPIVGSSQTIISPSDNDPSPLRLDRFVTVFGALRSDGRVDAREINVIKDIWANITLDKCGLVDGCSQATQLLIDGVPVATDSLQPGDLGTSYNYLLPDYSVSTNFKGYTFPGETVDRKLIVVEHTVRGPLEALDLDTGTLRILGQSVVTGVLDTYINGKPGGSDNSYWRDQKSLRSFTIGEMLEISGHETPTGEIIATGIKSAAGKDYRVIGLATAVNAPASRFTLQGLTVDYTGAFMDGFSGAAFHDGDRVLVTGDSYAAGILVAKRVSFLGRQVRGSIGSVLQLNGVITRYVSPDDFDVAGVPIHLTQGATKIDGCGTPRVNAFISIYGAMNPDGRIWSGIRPDLWCFRTGKPHSGALELSAPIDAIDLPRRLIHVLGLTLAVFDQTVINAADVTGEVLVNGPSVPLSDLHVGDQIFARGLLGSSNTNWTRVYITKNLGGPTIMGGVISAVAPDMVVGGVNVHTDAQTQFQGSCGTTSAAEAFDYLTKSLQSAGAASTPPIVSVVGSWAAPAVTAGRVYYGDTACPTP
jgi:Domain of unknown function (DUF5666)